MADYLAVWLVLLGAGCRTASKNWAFWRLLTLNQFSLVTGMGLTAAAVCVCACLCNFGVYVYASLHICACVKKWANALKRERGRACTCDFPAFFVVWPDKCGLAQNRLFNLAAILSSGGVYGSSLSLSWQSLRQA